MAQKIQLDLEANIGNLLQGTQEATGSMRTLAQEAVKTKTGVEQGLAAAANASNEVVKNNAQAAVSMGKLVESYKQLQVQARAAGGVQTDQGKAFIKQAGEVKSQIDTLRAATKAYASETQVFDTIAGGFGLISHSIEGVIGAQALLGEDTEAYEKTMKELLGIMALNNAATEIYEGLQAKSAFRIGISNAALAIQGFFLKVNTELEQGNAVALAENTVAQEANAAAAVESAAATGLAGVAVKVLQTIMKIFAVDAATAWAIATLGLSLLVTGVVLLASNFKELIGVTGKTKDELDEMNRSFDNGIAKMERTKELIAALGGSTVQIQIDIDTAALAKAKANLEDFQNKIESSRKLSTAGSLLFGIEKFELTPEQKKKLDEFQEAVKNADGKLAADQVDRQKQLNETLNALELDAMKARLGFYFQSLDAQLAIFNTERAQARAALEEKVRFWSDEKAARQALDAFDAASEAGRQKLRLQDVERERAYQKQLLDFKKQAMLAQGQISGPEQLLNIQNAVNLLELEQTKEHLKEVNRANGQAFALSLEQEQQFALLRLAIIKKGEDDRFNLLLQEQKDVDSLQADGRQKDLDAVDTKYAELRKKFATNGAALTQLQINQDREIAAVDLKYNLANLDAKEAHGKALVEQLQRGGMFETEFELFKEQKKFDIDKKFGEAKIALLQAQLPQATEEEKKALQKQVDDISTAIQQAGVKLENDSRKPQALSLGKLLFGGFKGPDGNALLDSEFAAIDNSINQMADSIKNTLSTAFDTAISKQQEFIQGIDDQIKAQQDAVKTQEDLAKQGLTNDLANERTKLIALKQQREEALTQQKKLQKEKQAVETAEQLSALITAAANIFQSLSKAGPVGLGIAVATTIAMFAAFVAAQAQANAAVKNSGFKKGRYTGDGDVDEIAGPVHRGEFVFDAEKTKKYRELFESIYDKDKPGIIGGVSELFKDTGVHIMNEDIPRELRVVKEQQQLQLRVDNSELKEEIKLLRAEVQMIRKQEKETIHQAGDKTIIKKGLKTKIIKRI